MKEGINMRRTHFYVFLALLVLALCLCLAAGAEGERPLQSITVRAPASEIGLTTAGTPTDTAAKLYLSRGTTLNLWSWADGNTNLYDMRNGQVANYFNYTYYGCWNVKVESGYPWLYLKNSTSGDWDWATTSNYSTTTRVGVIRISDSRGTIATLRIRQAGRTRMMSVTQIATGKIRVQYTGVTQLNGNIVYCNMGSGYFPAKYTHASLFYHENRPVGKTLYYYVRPYRVLGGKLLQGPSTSVISITVR